ncbi:hypothetical protein JTE90_000104 [Oedothorax gibbosus]|uniref:Uncharacterized protein n=1 Tax=Oedothorax gibbosus TaxID=931172 RepID=A0AAV6V0B3_9ARAC|nr:hypothetical protein JTE90_000104 [Oedothorax gibbosus]
MVSQSQEEWCDDGGLEGSRPRPTKTPPSYYDAVRSRHSLSQPPKSPERQDKSHLQQVKYNSLPRPLPQRFPPTMTNGQPVRSPWSEDPYAPNGTMRQQYDSPPKPANRVPLPLQVHHEKSPMKRGLEDAGCPPQFRGGPRQPTEKLTVDCSPRNGLDAMRKEGGMPYMRPEIRPPPPVPGRRPPQHRGTTLPNGMNGSNNMPKRDNMQNSGLLRRCYPLSSNGSTSSLSGYPAPTRPVTDNAKNYEPRYSKSGKLCPFNQEPRAMPPPVVMLRTGPLGTYPDPETLKRAELAAAYNNRQPPPERQFHRPLSQGDVSQQIFVDTNSYTNGQPMTTDHLAIPYRIPQVSSPKNGRSASNGMGLKNEPLSLPCSRQQMSPALQNSSPMSEYKSRTLPRDGSSNVEYRNRRSESSPGGNAYAPRNGVPRRNSTHNDGRMAHENDVIYANQQLPYRQTNGNNGYLSDQQRTPPTMNGNGIYENSQPRSGPRGILESGPNLQPRRDIKEPNPQHLSRTSLQDSSENLYTNHHIAKTHYNNQQSSSSGHQPPSNFENKHKNPRGDRRNTHPPPPVAQKPSQNLPQPTEMVLISETRGWNGQASSMYPKDVVKPTPRMPRLPNGVLASNAQLATVPAFQCVINELSTHPLHHISSPQTTSSSTLSLRSLDSSSTSSRDFGRKPSKSDSSADLRRSSENGLKLTQPTGKSLLSASMSSLCSDASSSWERMNDEKKKEKGSIFTTSPWEREKKEKLQQEQVLDARRVRDQEIAWLESVPEDRRSEKQSEWLRILRLEREFQRRAEMEPDDDGDSGDESSDDTATEERVDKVSSFPRDKLKVIPNERMGLKLLDDLLVNPTKSSPDKERDMILRTPSEKHFIPLDVTIPDNEIPSPTLPMTNNILKISSDQPSEGRSSKPPVPAPRPSKTCTPVSLCEVTRSPEIDNMLNGFGYGGDMESNVSSLAKLDISDSSAFFCSIENGDHSSRSTPQDNWLIEVPNSFEVPDDEARQDDAFHRNHSVGSQEGDVMEPKPKQHNGIYHDAFIDQRSRQQNGSHSRDDLREQKARQHTGIYEAVVVDTKLKPQNGHRVGSTSVDHKSNHYNGEQSRIYENIKPADYHYLRTQTVSGSSFTSHTLPKTVVSANNTPLATKSPPRSRPHDKKFPIMGVSSTLTKKGNGYVPSDVDMLPSLYASCKAQQNGYVKEVPSDLVDKSPEFKKMWISRPEKLTFQDKIRKFSIQAGEDDAPRDRVKNSRAQREIENKFVEGHKRPGFQKPVEF